MLNRVVALLVGLACLGGGVAANAVGQPPSPAATPYDELPVGSATSVPWWQHGRLHLGDDVIATDRSDIASRNGTTVVATDENRRTGRPTTWYLVEGTHLTRLPMRARADQPLISADGRWLAWSEVRAPRTDSYRRVERYRVVLYDAERRRIANTLRDRRLVAWEDGINGIWLRTLSDQGRLVLTRGTDGVQVFSPQGRPVRFDAPAGNGQDLDGWPQGTTVFHLGTERSVYGVVGADGGFERAGSFTAPFAGLWSSDGSAYAFQDYDDTTFWVRPLDGDAVQLDVPVDGPELRVVGWESAQAVLLWQLDDYSSEPVSRLVRCFAATGACERVPGGPKPGARATMPSRY